MFKIFKYTIHFSIPINSYSELIVLLFHYKREVVKMQTTRQQTDVNGLTIIQQYLRNH